MNGDAERLRGGLSRLGVWLLEELHHVAPPTIFFALGFNLVAFSLDLVVGQYLPQLGNFLVATTAALVVGKAVLVADKMPFLRRYDTAPLIWPILFKTVVYGAFVFVARMIEAYVHYIVDTGKVLGFVSFMLGQFRLHRFLFIQIWIFVLFLAYTTATEFNGLFGDGELFRLLFRWRTTELKLNRRQRIKALTAISRLTATYSSQELREPGNQANSRLFTLVAALGRKDERGPGR